MESWVLFFSFSHHSHTHTHMESNLPTRTNQTQQTHHARLTTEDNNNLLSSCTKQCKTHVQQLFNLKLGLLAIYWLFNLGLGLGSDLSLAFQLELELELELCHVRHAIIGWRSLCVFVCTGNCFFPCPSSMLQSFSICQKDKTFTFIWLYSPDSKQENGRNTKTTN